ncbi:MAG: cyclodeaminase/cyclohydrolase family protein [Chloroflexi bacterium]|nr:cyclodeaminase/cyclohydrolase family protein [Chloroflexota bacterium]
MTAAERTAMDGRLTELTVREVVERLASSDPAPGGGSAAALVGAMGAALVRMVVELSSPRADSAGAADALLEIGSAAATWQSELLNLAELDANAYSAVVRARRLPRGTAIERQARDVQVAAAIREATRAPLAMVRAALAVLELAERLAPIGTRNAISDVGVGGMLATTSARGAALNVRINLPYLQDPELHADATSTLDALLPGLGRRERALDSIVAERMA